MIEIFADPALVTQDFYRSLSFWGAIIAGTCLFLSITERRQAVSIPGWMIVLTGGIGFLVVAGINYHDTVGRFSSFSIREREVVLDFPRPFSRSKRVPFGDVRGVLFGLGKTRGGAVQPCYVVFELADGSSLRSASRNEAVDSCKALRESIIRKMAGQ